MRLEHPQVNESSTVANCSNFDLVHSYSIMAADVYWLQGSCYLCSPGRNK